MASGTEGNQDNGTVGDEVFDQFTPKPARRGATNTPPLPGQPPSNVRRPRVPKNQQQTSPQPPAAPGVSSGGRRGSVAPSNHIPSADGPGGDFIEVGQNVAGGVSDGVRGAFTGGNDKYEEAARQAESRNQPTSMGDRLNRFKRLGASAAEGVADSAGPMGKVPGGLSSEGATNDREQAVNDAAKVAGAAGSKAAYGDLAGAAIEGTKAAFKSKTGKKVIAGATAAILVLIMSVTAMALMITGAFTEQEGDGAAKADVMSPDRYSLVAAIETVDGQKDLDIIRRSAIEYGMSWQMVAAVWHHTSSSNLTGGQGPFNIDESVVNDSGDLGSITQEGTTSLERSADFISMKMSDAHSIHMYDVPNPQIDAGVTDGMDEDGNRDREMSEDERDVLLQEKSREAWLETLRALPVAGIDAQAEAIHSTALAWMKGEQPQMCMNPEAGLPGGGIATDVGSTSANLNESQVAYAQTIINRVAERGLPQHAAIVALATVSQESTFRMWWNVKVPGSEALTPEKAAKGRDGYSVGLYQQQVNGNRFAWGTVQEAMDPVKSTDMFLDALMRVRGWESLPVTVAAQKVQASAHPDKYADDEPLARQLVADLKPTSGWSSSDHEHDDVVESTGGSAGAPSSGGGAAAELKEGPNPYNLKVDTSLKPDVQLVQAAVVKYYGPAVNAMGGYRAGSVGHAQRIATDLMIANYKTPEGKAAGDKLAEFLLANRAALGVDYLIWQDRIWLGPSKGWEPYSKGGFGSHLAARGWDDTTLHMDHIHVETFGAKGTGGTLVGGNGDMSIGGGGVPGENGCNPGGLAGTSPIFGGVDGASFLGTDDYPHKMPGDVSWKPGSKDPGPDAWGMYKRECVSFVAWRLNQLMGWQPGQPYPFTKATMKFNGSANATNWGRELGQMGYKVDQTPAVGSVAWWEGGRAGFIAAGHVAIVLAVNPDGTVLIEQYSGGSVTNSPTKATYWQQTIPAGQPSGYIHVADVQPSAPTK
ncbi:CHAP domain-containing protein (plasmid) [Citricoccus nitrophenolicus]